MTDGATSDIELVSRSLAGDRDAFAGIVQKYQSLVCSLAYSATGSLGRSEELAQETFVVAWQRMAELREPEKLRSWLCGIVRRLTGKALRSASREPTHAAGPLESLNESHCPEPSPPDRAITREEETILWQSLERIPDNYREPLVLFYREQQSIQHVAAALELSEDTVKQRLSRGRKLLHREVLSMVEGVLGQTKPGRAFTFGVIAALPALTTTASAATIATVAAKGSAAASSASILTVVTSLLGPVIGLLGGWVGVRAGLESTRTPRERKFMIRQTKIMVLVMVIFTTLLGGYVYAGVKGWSKHPVSYSIVGAVIVIAYVGFIFVSAFRHNRRFRAIREEERKAHPEAYENDHSMMHVKPRNYRSKATFLGLPLIDLKLGTEPGERVKPAVGWIAIGDRAYGILFAAGGLAIGAISLGGAAVGILSFGGAAFGLWIALGGAAIGGYAIGGAAAGIIASGGLAIAWLGAEGGMAFARTFALGGQALAQHVNDEAARQFFAEHKWMDLTDPQVRNTFMLICWSPLLLVFWQFHRMRRLRKKHARSATSGSINGNGS